MKKFIFLFLILNIIQIQSGVIFNFSDKPVVTSIRYSPGYRLGPIFIESNKWKIVPMSFRLIENGKESDLSFDMSKPDDIAFIDKKGKLHTKVQDPQLKEIANMIKKSMGKKGKEEIEANEQIVTKIKKYLDSIKSEEEKD